MAIKRAKTMEDIARLANVSKPTVSRALRNSPLVTEETRRHVLDVATKHGYVINRNAQKLRESRANTIAVVLDFSSHRENRISDPFIFNLLAGVSEALGQRDQDLLLCSPAHSSVESLGSITTSRGADGIIFLGEGGRRDDLIALAERAVPFVVWGAVEKTLPYCAVGSDNFQGGFLAAKHLLDQGRSRFLFIGDTHHAEINLRRQGFIKALSEEMGARAANLVVSDMSLDDFSYGASHRAATEMVKGPRPVPDAIFAASDTAAMAVISAFRAAGLSVPEDVSVVGYNDIPASEHFHPPLTSVRQDVHVAGALLVEKLMLAIEGRSPQSTMLETRLIVRASS
ncbi:LacI family transcriptional regulator [Iodidimonas muriae]|uniref:LacI family transcriptional regulator n=1 Tax=Iodidimonas muriae TaxID=261467 RepID=A0ABQ2L5Y0_9PROT|nr:LacI family DNA-binding transcriptional regulator [Iodidimonas muriae]GER06409.1 LacI family transcriptional regulator [Kordiimonadales bacterium JCM 17843]GGO04659.1 LacI family transcriptional regulator [Iodidimonas muriae]